MGKAARVTAVAREQRRSDAFALKLDGWTYEQIAEHHGVDKSTSWHDVNARLSVMDEEDLARAKEVRGIEDARLEKVRRDFGLQFEQAKCPSCGRADVDTDEFISWQNALVKLSASRRKLWGVDGPVKIEINAQVAELVLTMGEAELMQLRRKLPALLEGEGMDAARFIEILVAGKEGAGEVFIQERKALTS